MLLADGMLVGISGFTLAGKCELCFGGPKGVEPADITLGVVGAWDKV